MKPAWIVTLVGVVAVCAAPEARAQSRSDQNLFRNFDRQYRSLGAVRRSSQSLTAHRALPARARSSMRSRSSSDAKGKNPFSGETFAGTKITFSAASCCAAASATVV